jgi:Holliday junction resolvase RusA-like endonuclease
MNCGYSILQERKSLFEPGPTPNIEIIFDHRLAVPPVTWKRARSRGAKRFNDLATSNAKAAMGWAVKVHEPQLRCSSTDRFGFRVTFYIARVRGGDGDRYENLLMDALVGVVWENDEQVDEGSWRKVYGADPGIHVVIWRIT